MEKSTVELLKGVDLFSALTTTQLESIAELATKSFYPKGNLIIREEDQEGHAFYLIASGTAQVVISSSDHRDTILSILSSGDFFGEMSLLDGEPRSASVRVESDAEVVVIQRSDFVRLLHKMPELSLALLTHLSLRLRRSNRQIGSLATMSTMGRVAYLLQQLVEEQGVRVPHRDGKTVVVLRNHPSQQQLAEMSGTTRESVSRALNEFRRNGIISWNRNELMILDELQLKERV